MASLQSITISNITYVSDASLKMSIKRYCFKKMPSKKKIPLLPLRKK